MVERFRKPAFGRHGRKCVAFLCGWELVALVPGSPVPTLSDTVKRIPFIGWVLIVLLGHHWFLEQEIGIEDIIDTLSSADQ